MASVVDLHSLWNGTNIQNPRCAMRLQLLAINSAFAVTEGQRSCPMPAPIVTTFVHAVEARDVVPTNNVAGVHIAMSALSGVVLQAKPLPCRF